MRDDPAGNRYELLIDGVRAGDLHYLPTRGAVVLVHTEIAPDLEGQGFGGRLIAGALEDLQTRELIIIPVCPFVRSYLERHPEHADLLERSTETREKEAEMASEEKIRNRIEELVGEEHQLWEAESRGEADDDARRRLGEVRLTLDQCWDLLRQRRALEESGLDVDAARVRPPETIERYDQ